MTTPMHYQQWQRTLHRMWQERGTPRQSQPWPETLASMRKLVGDKTMDEYIARFCSEHPRHAQEWGLAPQPAQDKKQESPKE